MRLRRRREAEPSAEAPTTTSSTPGGEAPASGPGARAARTAPAGSGPARRTEPAPAGFAGRTRDAGAATVGAVGSGVLAIARLVMVVTVLIAVLIGLAIVLRDVDANSSNTIVKGIHEGANFFAGSFTGLITFAGHQKRELTVDWGIALIVFLIVGAVIAGLIARVGRGGVSFERRHRALPSH